MKSPEPVPGRQRPPQIPGYRIEGVLGRGATGVVYRAVQLSIGRVVALKVLHKGAVGSTQAVRRLQREARTAARLAHPNIISAIDMGRSGDTWWFAMELVEGTSLAERLEHGGRLSERRALRIFIPLCDALQHAYEKGVVHRDIKPANILLESDERPRLVDLGLARVEDDPLLTRTGATLGTPHYISPEQARDPAGADARSDIWSLGATLFHAVCGRPPFTGESTAELLSDVLYGGIPDPRELRPELSKGLALVLRKCLSRDPLKRYHTPAELKEDLERVRDRRAPVIKESALEPLRAGGLDRRMGWLAAGVGGLALLAVTWAVIRQGARRDAPAETRDEVAAWPALEALVADLDAGRLSLAGAWAERAELCASPPVEFHGTCLQLQQELAGRIERSLYEYTRELEAELARLSSERRFERALALIGEEARAGVAARTGFRPEQLPLRFGPSFEHFLQRQRETLERARDGAAESLVRAVEFHVEQALLPRVAPLVERGRFEEALALVELDQARLFEAAGADASGLEARLVDERLEPLRARLTSLAYQLRKEWRQVDLELGLWIERRAGELGERLRARRASGVAEIFAADFDAELARRRLERSTLEPSAQHPSEWSALARFEQKRSELAAAEHELRATNAELRFAELDGRVAEMMRAREYESARAFWAERLADPALAPLERMVELRREEAELLEALLATAAEGVRGARGRELDVPVGSVLRSGRLEVAGDPLASGFELVYKQGTRDSFRLRRGEQALGGAIVLEAKALEAFVLLGASDPESSELVLQRALFRYHEGDLPGARELYARHSLSDEDYLVHDLGLRLAAGLDRAASARAARRQYAQDWYERLTGRTLEGDPKLALRRIDELLGDFSEFFDSTQAGELRELRRSLGGTPPPATLEDFERAFGPGRVQLEGRNALALAYTFAEPEVFPWDRGDWHCDGAGWIRSAPVASDDELTRVGAPRLALVPPFVAGTSIELELAFEQPPDSPPNLLVLSALGYHAVFVRGSEGGPARCHVDTQELAQVLARARAGEGLAFSGFTRGARHEIRVQLWPEAGRFRVWVDGNSLSGALRRQPPQKLVPAISLRSLEPLRLCALRITGGRR